MKKKMSQFSPRFTALLGVMLILVLASGVSPARSASASQGPGVTLVPGTVTVSEPMQDAVVDALQVAADLPSSAIYFAITDVRRESDWALVSVIGLAQVHAKQEWSLEQDGVWTGLVLLHRLSNGKWTGATQGTASFSSLLDAVPETFIRDKAKRDLDPKRRPPGESLTASTIYTFPWQGGMKMSYGYLGVHDNGFSGIVSGWKAVDMLSDGDTAAGHAPNQLLAAAPGTITYRCVDDKNMAIHLGDFFYTHINRSDENYLRLETGNTFEQGQFLGDLKKGRFKAGCGWADQPDGWFHVHWGFPNANLHVENWTLSMSTQKWTNGSTTVSPGGWITAGGTDPCAPPALTSPVDGLISTDQTMIFTWSASSGCIFSGYMFRVRTVQDMDSANGDTIVDAISAGTSRTQTISSDWDGRDLYWGVKAANAPFGASWSVRRFKIDPGTSIPTDYGYCADNGERCAFSGPALVIYGVDGDYVGPLPFTDGVDCAGSVFGGTITGAQCFLRGGQPEGSTWCADQGGTCNVGAGNLATVYYGANAKYNTRTNLVGSVACDNATFGDPFPGLDKACYYIVTGSTTALTFTSAAYLDGWVLESAEGSGVGGAKNGGAWSFFVGDDASNRQYRSILSFDTSSLPDTALIDSVKLEIKRSGQAGSNWFRNLGKIAVDIRTWSFSGARALEVEDFEAPASKASVMLIGSNAVDGWYSRTLDPAYFAYVNKAGPTQFRLRFQTADNNNNLPDYLKFYSGNYTTADDRPKLTISYHLP